VRLFPGSILWRTLIVIVAALVLSQATAWLLLEEFVNRPRIALAINQTVSHLKTVNAALATLDANERSDFIERMREVDGIRIASVERAERLEPAPDRPVLRQFRARIREVFGPEAEVYHRRARNSGKAGTSGDDDRLRGRVLWVRLPSVDRTILVGFPRGRIERDLSTAFIAWTVASLGIAILATFFLVWRLNRPLGQLARAAAAVGKGDQPAPVAETGPAEIRSVARAFNQMTGDLAKAQRERATFLAGISHDLRTPLARLRLDVEMLGGKVDAPTQRGMVQDLEDMNAIIDQFIDFMRSEAAEPFSGVNLSELSRACAERAARLGTHVTCELADVPVMMLRPLAMQRLIDNLLNNAARHAGGEILLRTRALGNLAELSVLDRGPGIPAELAEHLKQPFTRRDEARSGSSGAGLGLAIAQRVASLHHGQLELLPREGGGLEARVTLPMAA
jgi:two-component system osmolarity sensor histidine kinase EnvZ